MERRHVRVKSGDGGEETMMLIDFDQAEIVGTGSPYKIQVEVATVRRRLGLGRSGAS